jgi:beta-N-acetylhexosaminidase
MMICHAWYPTFDVEKMPASLSPRVVTDLLRDDLQFEGLVMTDDLDMGAIYNEYALGDTIRMAISAGNDLAMICHRIDAIGEARDALADFPYEDLERALDSVARFKERLAPPHEFSRRLSAVSTRKSGSFGSTCSGKSAPRNAARKTANGLRSRPINVRQRLRRRATIDASRHNS